MEQIFKLVFVYPDGHIEEVEETFYDAEKAKEYGNSLLVQVQNTEEYFNHNQDDELGFGKKRNPYYMVVEVTDNKYSMVFESKH